MSLSHFGRAVELLRTLPRISLGNLRPSLERRKRKKTRSGKQGRGKKGQLQRNTLPRLGFEGGNTPFYLLIPKEPYYAGHHLRREYEPLSFLSLQRLVDLGWLDVEEPIDLTSLSSCPIRRVSTALRQFGFNLTDESADLFNATINLEVQAASELAIATIERNGGCITTKFYDPICVEAMVEPTQLFRFGNPIPRNKLPPKDAVDYYSDPRNRGYLADPDEIEKERQSLAQKYGYELPDLSVSPKRDMLLKRKDPRQIWFGLEPGWVINLRDKTILRPTDPSYVAYYTA